MKTGTAEQEQKGVTIPKEGRQDVSHKFRLSGQDLLHLLRREKAPDNGHDIDDHRQHQDDLDGVIDEEIDGIGQMGARRHLEYVIGEPVGKSFDQFSFLMSV